MNDLDNQTQPSAHNEPSSLKFAAPIELAFGVLECEGFDKEAAELRAVLTDMLAALQLLVGDDGLGMKFSARVAAARAAITAAVGDRESGATSAAGA